MNRNPDTERSSNAHLFLQLVILRQVHVKLDRLGEEKDPAQIADRYIARLITAGEFAYAAEFAEAMPESLKKSGLLWLRLGVAKWRQGALSEARAAMDKALDLGASRPDVLARRGELLVDSGQFEEALADLREALKNPSSKEVQVNLRAMDAYALTRFADDLEDESQRQTRLRWALARFKGVLDEMPDDPDVNYWYALACIHIGKTDEASSHLRLALESSTPPLSLWRRAEAEEHLRTLGTLSSIPKL